MKIRKDRIDTNEQKTTTRNSQRIIIHKEKKPIGLKGPGVNLILSVPESKDKNIKLFNSFQKKKNIKSDLKLKKVLWYNRR